MLGPWQDAAETVLDLRRREQIVTIGQSLVTSAWQALDIAEVATHALTEVDEVLASCRISDAAVAISAGDSGDAALAHLDSDAEGWPSTGFAALDAITRKPDTNPYANDRAGEVVDLSTHTEPPPFDRCQPLRTPHWCGTGPARAATPAAHGPRKCPP